MGKWKGYKRIKTIKKCPKCEIAFSSSYSFQIKCKKCVNEEYYLKNKEIIISKNKTKKSIEQEQRRQQREKDSIKNCTVCGVTFKSKIRSCVRCKRCVRAERYLKNKKQENVREKDIVKTCVCGCEFKSRNKSAVKCKKCNNREYQKINKDKNRQANRENKETIGQRLNKKCTLCSCTESKYWVGDKCQSCYQKELRATGYYKKQYEKDKEEILKKNKEWRQRNPEKVIKNKIEYEKIKMKTDPVFNLKKKLRHRLRKALRAAGTIKSYKTDELLGCTVNEFKEHIESLFLEGMTWEKLLKGEIHLDHKVPICSYDITDIEQQKKAFHFTNIQPLWAEDNIKKNRALNWKKQNNK